MVRIATAACLIAGFFQEPRPVEIHFLMWKPHQREAWSRTIRDFEKSHPSIRVRVEEGPHSSSELHALLVTKLRARDPKLDVFLIDVVWPAELAAAGYLDPLDDLIAGEDRKRFFPGTIEADTVDGRLVAAPFNVDAGLLYYRKDLLQEAGFEPPETWNRLAEQSAAICARHPDMTGYTGQFDRYEGLVCNMMELIRGNGGRMVHAGDVRLDERAEEAVAWVRDHLIGRAAPRQVLNQRETESREVFLQGQAVFHRNWPETWKLANDPARSRVSGKVGMARMPRFDKGRSVSTLGGWQLAIAAHSSRKQEAREFVRYLTSPEVQKRLTLETSHGPSVMAVMDDPEVLARFPHFSHLKPVLLAAEPRPRWPDYAGLSDRLQRELYSRLTQTEGGISVIPPVISMIALGLIVFYLSRGRKAGR
jgi:multiple sugar transport system substrate-binding protein